MGEEMNSKANELAAGIETLKDAAERSATSATALKLAKERVVELGSSNVEFSDVLSAAKVEADAEEKRMDANVAASTAASGGATTATAEEKAAKLEAEIKADE